MKVIIIINQIVRVVQALYRLEVLLLGMLVVTAIEMREALHQNDFDRLELLVIVFVSISFCYGIVLFFRWLLPKIDKINMIKLLVHADGRQYDIEHKGD